MQNNMELENKKTPRDFFLYLFSTAGVYYIAGSVIALLWRYVDYFFPDKILGSYSGLSSGLRFSVASLIVVFPAYVVAMRFLARDIDNNPEKQDLKVRKWLIYLTLFVSAIAVIIDLVAVIYNFLGGDLVARFALKSLSVLLVALAVFGYYYFVLKRVPGTKEKEGKRIAWVASVFVAATVVGAFFMIGSPETNRLLNIDGTRISDLQNIQWQIVNFWQQKGVMPSTLDMLTDNISGFVVPKDPVTKEPYEYVVVSGTSFSLCSTFALESNEKNDVQAMPVYGISGNDSWVHKAGHQCFERKIDPELYPVREGVKPRI
ncbi:MAG: DUF5671 domain-containing protein [Candidatus Paceibacterota bacterium]|jgi:hypothetical protein